jgi:hypothetical protein
LRQRRTQAPKAYLRFHPDIDQHPDVEGMVMVLCAANRQTPRGRFHDIKALERVLLGDKKRAAAFLKPRMAGKTPDISQLADGTLYVVGWDEWQEGDWTVGERQKRIRERRESGSLEPLLNNVGSVTPALPSRYSTPNARNATNGSLEGNQSNRPVIGSTGKTSTTPLTPNFSERTAPPPSNPCPNCGQEDSVRKDFKNPEAFFCGTRVGGCGHNWTRGQPADDGPNPVEVAYLAKQRAQYLADIKSGAAPKPAWYVEQEA